MRVLKQPETGHWVLRASMQGEQSVIDRISREILPGSVFAFAGVRKRGGFSVVSFNLGKNGNGHSTAALKNNVLAFAGTTEDDKKEVDVIGSMCCSGLVFLESTKLEKGKTGIVVCGMQPR